MEQEELKIEVNKGKQELFCSLPDSIFEALYGGAKGGGKLLSLSELISSEKGLVPISNIHVGDKVFSPTGDLIDVIWESEIQEQDTYKITFDDEFSITAGSTHQWKVFNAKDREKELKRSPEFREKRKLTRPSRSVGARPDMALVNSQREYNYKGSPLGRIRTTEQLYKRFNLIQDKNNLDYRGYKVNRWSNYSIPLASPLIYSERHLLIDPYVLGAWLGDGTSLSGQITGIDNQVFDEIRKAGYEVNDHKCEKSHGILNLIWKLKQYNLNGNKHIPEVYFTSSYNQRLSLLQGLMDTDGYCAEDGQCEFVNINKDLAKGVARLASSLGIKIHFSYGIATLNGKLTSAKYRVLWTDTLNVFRLQRKLDRLKKLVSKTQKNHYITNIEKIQPKDLKCIQVSNPDGLYLCSENNVTTHNSHALRILPLLREWYKIPTFHGIILRRTYPELEKHQIMEAHKIYPYFGGKYNSMYKRYVFPSGARIQFGSAEYESDIKNYDSGEYHFIAFDELTSFTEFQYRYMLGMCRTSDKRLPNIVRSGTNPGNIGHSWVRDRFVEPYKDGGKIIIDKTTKMKRIFIQAFATDNPVLMEATPDYLNQLDLLPEAEKRAKKYGDWYTFSGQVFREFRSEQMPDEPENACHKISSLTKIPDWTQKIIAVDWGFQASTYVSWAAIFPNKRIVVYREYCKKEKTVEQWTTEVAEQSLNDRNIVTVAIDPSAWQNRGQGTIVNDFTEIWRKVTGQEPPVIKANNDRISGKMLIHEFLRWKPLPKVEKEIVYNRDIADTILRLNGLEAHKNYLLSCIPPSSTDEILPRLLITENCKELLKTIPLCVYSENSRVGKNIEDVAEFAGDDPYDNLRYLLKAAQTYFDSASINESKEAINIKRIEVCKELEETKDETRFYRKMEHLERSTTVFNKPIKLHQRRRSFF